MSEFFNTVPIAPSIGRDDYLHVTQGNTHVRVEAGELVDMVQRGMLDKVDEHLLDLLTCGCGILYRESGEMRVCRTSAWPALQNSGKEADGVAVLSPLCPLVVAPTGSPLLPFREGGGYDVESVSTYPAAMCDMRGEEKTRLAMADTTLRNDSLECAIGFCGSYARGGIGIGKWWLPSTGEALVITSFLPKINMCLGLIAGATPITGERLWCVTECDGGVWCFDAHGWIGKEAFDGERVHRCRAVTRLG